MSIGRIGGACSATIKRTLQCGTMMATFAWAHPISSHKVALVNGLNEADSHNFYLGPKCPQRQADECLLHMPPHTIQAQVHMPCIPKLPLSGSTPKTQSVHLPCEASADTHALLAQAAPEWPHIKNIKSTSSIPCVCTQLRCYAHVMCAVHKRSEHTKGTSSSNESWNISFRSFGRASNATIGSTLQRESMMATFACAVHNNCTSYS
jgi:hypothetical protein